MSTPEFKDHFSGHAQVYAQNRPGYPRELFSLLSQTAQGHRLAWDCATGNGQAAVGLAPYFSRIIATDASAQQIKNAQACDGVEYAIAPAHESGIDAQTVDLVCVAQAIHWFDIEQFYSEVDRVLAPSGTLAYWTYGLFETEDAIERVVRYVYDELTGPWWPPERELVEREYRDIRCPYPEIEVPRMEISLNWSLNQVLGYIASWSATQKMMGAGHEDLLSEIESRLIQAWGHCAAEVEFRWPLIVKMCQKQR